MGEIFCWWRKFGKHPDSGTLGFPDHRLSYRSISTIRNYLKKFPCEFQTCAEDRKFKLKKNLWKIPEKLKKIPENSTPSLKIHVPKFHSKHCFFRTLLVQLWLVICILIKICIEKKRKISWKIERKFFKTFNTIFH